MSGQLFIVATPIGNLQDITERALEVLKSVSFVICEDTRHSRVLLDKYGIAAQVVSLPAHSEQQRSQPLVERLVEGETAALITDAGTPAISDPGEFFVREAVSRAVEVIPIPGPSALIAALSASGRSTGRFHFLGFLPRQNSDMESILQEVSALRASLVLYESPRRLVDTLKNLLRNLGDRQATVARELTKIHEEFIRGPLTDLVKHFERSEPLGEIVVIVEGHTGENRWHIEEVKAALNAGLARGEKLKGLARDIAEVANWSVKEIYQLGLLQK